MGRASRLIASTIGFAFVLTACGGQTVSPPMNLAMAISEIRRCATPRRVSRSPRSLACMAILPIPMSDGTQHATVRVSLTLRYNHQAQLDRLVATLSAGHGRHRFLTQKET